MSADSRKDTQCAHCRKWFSGQHGLDCHQTRCPVLIRLREKAIAEVRQAQERAARRAADAVRAASDHDDRRRRVPAAPHPPRQPQSSDGIAPRTTTFVTHGLAEFVRSITLPPDLLRLFEVDAQEGDDRPGIPEPPALLPPPSPATPTFHDGPSGWEDWREDAGRGRLVFWDDIRPDRRTDGSNADDVSARTNPLQRGLAQAVVERGWTTNDVQTVIDLLRKGNVDENAKVLPATGATFMRNIESYLPSWHKHSRHKEPSVEVDGLQYKMFVWDPLVQLGVLLQKRVFAEFGKWSFEVERNERGERVYKNATGCARFEGKVARQIDRRRCTHDRAARRGPGPARPRP